MKNLELNRLAQDIHDCTRCPRLRRYCETVAREKRRAYRDETYVGLPVSGFGDPKARLVLVGLAPAAHGANRTGRIFTGDRSGDWLFRALHKAGFANQAESRAKDDGLELRGTWVTCAVRCAPPGNKPLPLEFSRCRPFLDRELALLPHACVFVALGGIALTALERHLRAKDLVLEKNKWKFGHGATFRLRDGRLVLASFHPSQQNTFTGRLTEPMFDGIFRAAREDLSDEPPAPAKARDPRSKASRKLQRGGGGSP